MGGGQDLASWRCEKHGGSFFEDDECPKCAEDKKRRWTVARYYSEGKDIHQISLLVSISEKETEDDLRTFIKRILRIYDAFKTK